MNDGDAAFVVETVRGQLQEAHDEFRALLGRVPADLLDRRPAEDANSISVLVAHSLDAERFLVATAADTRVERDREAQFRVQGLSHDELLGLIDRLEADVAEHLENVTAESLARRIERPGRIHQGLWWLLHALEHTREHLGQASLTAQVLENHGIDDRASA